MQQVVTNIDELKQALPAQMQKCLAFFPGVDRTVGGYEGLIAAQECLPNNDTRDKFAAEYSRAGTPLGGALAGPVLERLRDRLQLADAGLRVGQAPQRQRQAALARPRRQDHRADQRERPRRSRARRPRDAGARRRCAGRSCLTARTRTRRPRRSRSSSSPACVSTRTIPSSPRWASGWRRSRSGTSRACSQPGVPEGAPGARQGRRRGREGRSTLSTSKTAKAALTELFDEVKNGKTPVIVERIVTDIDEIVRLVRFPGWQHTKAGEREVQKALRKAILQVPAQRSGSVRQGVWLHPAVLLKKVVWGFLHIPSHVVRPMMGVPLLGTVTVRRQNRDRRNATYRTVTVNI